MKKCRRTSLLVGLILIASVLTLVDGRASASAESGDAMPKNGTHTLMQRKMAEGIGFFAVGNEPSWALDIDFDQGMRFKSPSGLPELNTPPGREDKAQDADVTRFFAGTEAGTLIVTVSRGRCTDTMSGEIFPFRVKIDVKRSVDADYKTVEGCGRYVDKQRGVQGQHQDRKIRNQHPGVYHERSQQCLSWICLVVSVGSSVNHGFRPGTEAQYPRHHG
ncbi:MAG: hypothetical protein WAK95_16970 [Desulfobacterales bacterium]